MRVFLTGGTGLIGRRLVRRLIDRGDQPIILSRQADKARLNPSLRGSELVQGDPGVSGGWEAAVDGCDAVINLVGHNIFDGRWSPAIKRKIRDSRIDSTENLVAAVASASVKPKVFVQGSAIGYYGPHGDEELTESSPPGHDFMATLCQEWENAARPVEGLGARLSVIRTGIVLAREAGALAVMTPIFKLLGGTPVGSGGKPLPATGSQWMSWIHIDDIVGLFLLGLDNPSAVGPINGTAPNPARNADFSRTLARVLRETMWPGRSLGLKVWPPFLPFGPPDLMMHLVLGEVAQVILDGQRVLPSKANALGYTFRFPELEGALRDLFASKPSETPVRGEAVGAAG